jgi:hypothetical protein
MIGNLLLQSAARLRYPKLLALALGPFIADLIAPDFMLFFDEILPGRSLRCLAG